MCGYITIYLTSHLVLDLSLVSTIIINKAGINILRHKSLCLIVISLGYIHRECIKMLVFILSTHVLERLYTDFYSARYENPFYC